MPFEQTITIINNSGKIISTGKHLVGIFREAHSAYKEKKESLKQGPRGASVRRAHTYHGPIVEEYDDSRNDDREDIGRRNHRSLGFRERPMIEDRHRHLADDSDRRSGISSDSHRRPRLHRSSTGRNDRKQCLARPPLTISNLRTLSEVSSTLPSAVPQTYRTLASQAAPPNSQASETSNPRAHPTSSPALVHRGRPNASPTQHVPMRPVDLNLAYGDIPPDLASRVDLDEAESGDGTKTPGQAEAEARTLVDRVESLLNEAQCIHHTAASIIRHLQESPEAAAAVALTLAELSALLTKMSPAFLGVVKGGSPAVFALLSSPQFLIGSSIAVGVTVVVFGGWKIVKRIAEVKAAREEGRLALEMVERQALPAGQSPPPLARQIHSARTNEALPSNINGQSVHSGDFDEALVIEEELSTIECWRRGIVEPPGLEGQADPWEGTDAETEAEIELISPEAMRSRIALDIDQTTVRSSRTRKTTSSRSRHQYAASEVDRRRSHKERSSRSSELPTSGSASLRNKDSGKSRGRSRDRQGSRVGRAHSQEQGRRDGSASEAGSVSTTRTGKSGRSSRHMSGKTHRESPKAGSRVTEAPPSGPGPLPGKDKKTDNGGNSMLKQLFKKKKQDKSRSDTPVSVLA